MSGRTSTVTLLHGRRKAEHLDISLNRDVAYPRTGAGFDDYRFVHQALPGFDLDAVDTESTLLGRRLGAPLLISSMVGGIEEAARINRNLAAAAQHLGLAMGVGSQRCAVEDPSLADTFQVRDVAPDIFLCANLGAVQLNYGYGVAECRRAVDMIGADALILHLNPLQEALQPGGNTRFGGLLTKIEGVCRAVGVPVIAKEVCFGISTEAARMLADAGVSAIDVAGAGGTSWSEVEKHRAGDESAVRVAAAFADWGIPTARSLAMAREGAPHTPIIASGGVRSGIDAATALALGAAAAGVALPLLRPALDSPGAVITALEEIIAALRISMFCAGAPDIAALRRTPLVRHTIGG